MLMKDFFNLRKSKLLLLTLLAFFVGGVSPAWAEAVTLPYSYGFEDYNLATDGWTTANPSGRNSSEFAIVGAAKKTGSYGFRFSSYNGSGDNTQYLISPEFNAPNGLIVSFQYAASNTSGTEKFKVGYSTTDTEVESFTFRDEVSTNSTSWTEYKTTFPAGTKYVAVYYYSNYQYRLYVDDFTFEGVEVFDGPALKVFDGETALATDYSYNFGLATAGTEKTFTLTNPGTETATVSVSHTGDFGVELSATSIPAGESVSLTVTMADATGSDVITISSTDEGIDDFVINVSGTIRDANKVYESGFTTLPQDWTTSGSWYYSEANGAYTTSWYLYSNSRLITPKLIISEGETFFVEAKGYSTSNTSYQHLQMQYSADGETWTNFDDEPTLDPSEWNTYAFTGAPAGQYYIAINASQADIRMFYGGELYVPTGAKFAIDPTGTTQDFGLTAIGGNLEKAFTMTNAGNEDLTVTFTAPEGFSVLGGNTTFLLTDNFNWGSALVYAWDANQNPLNGAWPGTTYAETVTNNYGETQFKVVVPNGAVGVIVNNGNGAQTEDITNLSTYAGFWMDGATDSDGHYKVTGYGEYSNPAISSLTVAAGESKSFTVKMNTATAGAKSGTLSLALSDNVLDATSPYEITLSGVVMPADATVVDFNDNQLPAGWGNNASNKWSFADGKAYCTYAAELTTPKLQFAEGDFFVISATSYDNYDNNYIEITGSVDGSDWTAFTAKKFVSRSQIPYGSYASLVVTGIPTTVKYLKFKGYYVRIDEISGLKFSGDAPVFAYYTDSECTTAATATEAKDFGFVTEAPAAQVYYIKNDGTGTMSIALGDVPTGFTAALGETALASGESTTLTINMPAETKGYHSGNIVVTAKDSSEEEIGTFTVTASGVMMEEGKMNLNFAADDVIPTTWTATDWTKNDGGYYRGGYSSTTIETSTLTAAAGEEIVIVAKQEYASGSFSVNYKKDDAEEWSTLIASTSLGNSNWVTLHAPIAEAGDYKFQIVGNYYTQIQRIYGLTTVAVPFMETTAANIAFGMQTAESAEQTFTISNTGEATLTGLSVTLGKTDDAAEYAIRMTDSEDAEFTGTELAVGQTITVHVKQLFNAENLGSKSDVLTIAADGQTTVTINLTGTTRDGSLLYVDFDEPNAFPEGWQAGANWSMYTFGTDRYAYQSSSNTPSALVTTPLTVEEGQTLSFKVARNSSGYGYTTSLKTRYSQDGGVNWSEYAAQYGTDSSNEAGSAYTTIELSELPAGNLIFEFYGNNIKLDMIQGVKTTTAPALALTEGGAAVENGSTKDFGNLSTDGVATYTVKNTGNAVLKSTITGEGVTVSPASVELAAGETAEITVTMAFGEPYGAKTGSMKIESEDWVGDMTVNYTASLLDPTDFVIDFEDNAKPAGWYSEAASSVWSGWVFTGGNASINTGTAKPMITELVGAEEGKNVLSFDAKAYNGDYQTLNVYTSADRKTWSEAQAFTLTAESQTFSLGALADGSYYVKFEASNAIVDNIKGVKKLDAPEHDLYYVSATWPTGDVTPDKSYSVSVDVASLRAEETVTAQLFFGETMLAEQTKQVIANGATKTFTLTGTAPAAGTYDVYAKVFNADGTVETKHQSVTVEDTRYLNITAFTRTSEASVVADENNEFTATFNVTVQNTGTASLSADEVSVSLTDGTNAYQTVTWTTESSDVLYMNTSNGTDDIAADDAQLAVWMWGKSEGEWASFTKINDGFYSVALNGNTNFIVVRTAPGKELSLDDCWNKTGDMSLTGNLIKFTSYNGSAMNFNTESMGYLEPTMSTTLKVSVKLSAGEGGAFTFYAKENVSDTQYFLSQSVNVTKNVATGVSRLLTDDELEGLDIYNLQGQRVEKTAKGLLIINGKKVVRK